MPGPLWTIPNLLSISRIPFSVAAAIIVLSDGSTLWCLILIFAAGLTDFLDGQVARLTNTVSDWGKLLDPAADKISAALLGGSLAWKELLPPWFVGAIILRDVIIVAAGIYLSHYVGRIHMSNFFGKIATTAIGITFILGLLKADPLPMNLAIWGTVGLLGLSLLVYAPRLADLRNKPA